MVCLGMGLGYQLAPLVKAPGGLSPIQKIILVERDLACFRRALEVSDLSLLTLWRFAEPQLQFAMRDGKLDGRVARTAPVNC